GGRLAVRCPEPHWRSGVLISSSVNEAPGTARPRHSGGATGDDPADELQVGGHVVFDRAARAVAFELRPFVEADVGERVNHGLEIYFPPAEVIGVVLEVNFADPLATEPADLFDDVIAVLRGIA